MSRRVGDRSPNAKNHGEMNMAIHSDKNNFHTVIQFYDFMIYSHF